MTSTLPARTVATADWEAWTCRVRLAVTDPAALDEARELLVDDLATVDLACSRFRPDAELALLDGAQGRWVTVSPLLTEALQVAVRAARLTAGDVDPTVGGAMAELGYDRDLDRIDPGAVPGVVHPVAGWQTVELDVPGNRVRVPAGVRLDLGATAKAWTADRAAAEITRRTGAGVLVSIGGDVAVAGPAPEGGWRVRVSDVTGDPDGPAPAGSAVVTLTDGGLATSSTRARRWLHGGVEVHHLLDPRTGLPARSAWRTVSVAAGSCVDANTVSTACVVRGHRALPWLRELGVPARLVTEDGDVLTAGGWPA
ncbi:thiamine biosynthesis protein [Geodermatophilus sp. Leaf369]|uniref:FAD:protein FMN transferase n=1 Tax=Geodermatophilus sp. Leaf369 TaxID=1736354 RepID=UPI0006F3167E|nr:FAD:protein FMN transferase [Geodermatophilus sp. Leaf369]KQS58840.1 thiamine biosynthesis protein [Geodermatophilus sp. Leaf369]QNG36309.1 FAD:protein FMN transferase [Geodermatophilaceae bacterium NBWT11]